VGHGDAINDIAVQPSRPDLFLTASRVSLAWKVVGSLASLHLPPAPTGRQSRVNMKGHVVHFSNSQQAPSLRVASRSFQCVCQSCSDRTVVNCTVNCKCQNPHDVSAGLLYPAVEFEDPGVRDDHDWGWRSYQRSAQRCDSPPPLPRPDHTARVTKSVPLTWPRLHGQ